MNYLMLPVLIAPLELTHFKSGFLYLAVVIDVFSRRVVGWAMASHLKTELVLDALNMALEMRRPHDVIHHSDQGTQYTSYAFGQRCRKMGVRPSVGSVGDCYDNAMCESFFATLECESLDRKTFSNHETAKMAIVEYIEGWYDLHRRHSALQYKSPIDYEKLMEQDAFLESSTLSTKRGNSRDQLYVLKENMRAEVLFRACYRIIVISI